VPSSSKATAGRKTIFLGLLGSRKRVPFGDAPELISTISKEAESIELSSTSSEK
jgi:hypothetical protein